MTVFDEGTVLLVDRKSRSGARLYKSPGKVVRCKELSEADRYLQQIDFLRGSGAHLAGFFSYEFGWAFEPKLASRPLSSSTLPLAWFGAYEPPQELDARELDAWLDASMDNTRGTALHIKGFDLSRSEYEAAFRATQTHLAQGDIYQINLTMRAEAMLEGDPINLFRKLLFQQPVDYAALMKIDGHLVLSISPELFLKREGQNLTCKPMKGTAARGRTVAEDRKITQWLANDAKSRAENTMILDLMRNDLSRIAKPGSVCVPSLCEVERYRSLFQMTSTTTGQLRDGVGLPRIIQRLFPCGSITGAPKLRAMEIISDLEATPRGVYTGSIGSIDPSGDFCFNIAIRTLVVDNDGRGTLGTGSGVVYDSGAAPEYDECLLKLQVFAEPVEPFTLFETMRWTPEDGFFLLERHLRRLMESAAYFDFPFDACNAENTLRTAAEQWPAKPHRVRLDLDDQGRISLVPTALTHEDEEQWTVCITKEPVCAQNRFLFHKTSHRKFYDQTRKAYQSRWGCREVLFCNEDGFVTEGSFTNLFVELDGKLLTPHLHHGLLPGTFRAGLLDYGYAEEADITPDMVQHASALYLGNSLRGLVPVRLLPLQS